MPHLKRASVLLALALVLVLVVPRIIPRPVLLANFGFHPRNSEENTARWAGLPASFASSSVCNSCHQAKYDMWQKGNHRVVNCENCHGPAAAHLQNGAPERLDTSRELCGTCHSRLVSRPAAFPQVDMDTMGGDASCVSCHDPHDPRAGMPPQVPHALDDRTDCQSCHASHEPFEKVPPQVPHTLEGRTECLSCHGPSEFRGATLPHVPAGLAGTDCLTCHTATGVKPLPGDHAGRTSATCQNCHRTD